MALRLVEDQGPSPDREVLEFDCGVRAYTPASAGAYWRIRWEESGRRRDTTARSRSDAITKAGELVERLGRGSATDLSRANGANLVSHYLDPARRPARVERWSERHRDEQVRYCERFVLPVLGTVACRRMTRLDFKAVLDQAPTPSVAQHLLRCLTALVAAGLEEGHLLARQDVLRGVRWHPRAGSEARGKPELAITEAEIPTTAAVHALALAAAERSGVWWRELGDAPASRALGELGEQRHVELVLCVGPRSFSEPPEREGFVATLDEDGRKRTLHREVRHAKRQLLCI